MAYYYARVELHEVQPGEDSYDILHQIMAELGFRREIGKWKLPKGTYLSKSRDKTPDQLRDKISKVVGKIKKKCSVVVVRFNHIQDLAFLTLQKADS